MSLAACSRSAPQAPPKPPPPLFEYLGEWGVKGDGPGKLNHPTGLAVDDVGNVYITDVGTGFIHKFEVDGHPLLSFQDDAVKYPDGIALDRGGAIYVTDPVRGRVVIFLPDGTRYFQISCAPGRKSAEPLKVAVDEEGDIYVADARLHRIEKFTLRGRRVKAWGQQGNGPGSLKSPGDIAAGLDGFLYGTDTDNGRVVKFTREGEFVSALAVPPPQTVPVLAGLAVSAKYVFAVDSAARRLHVWALDGQHKLSENLGNRLLGEAPVAYGIAVSPRGELVVLDPAGARVLRFRINF